MAAVLKVAKPGPQPVIRSNGAAVAMEVAAETGERHAFVPDEQYAEKYVHRKVYGIHDFDLLKDCRDNGLNLLLMGNTGSGKTMLPMAYAAQNKLPYYSVPCDVSIDPTALFGKMMPGTKVGEFEWSDGPVTELVRYGGVLNISEINFMPPKIAASLYSLLDHRRSVQLLGHRGEHVQAHKELLIVADMNPKYRGTVDLNIALANRFPMKVAWEYDKGVEKKLVKSAALLELVESIRKETEIRTPIGTNLMMEFASIASRLGVKFAIASFVLSFAENERQAVSQMMDVASENIASEIAKVPEPGQSDAQDIPADPSWLSKGGFDPGNFEFESVD
jgi:MoxR-like ATPase